MEFKALRVPALTEEVAQNLEKLFADLPGIEKYTIAMDSQELDIIFDENQLSFRVLVQEMTAAGCSLQSIDAALLL